MRANIVQGHQIKSNVGHTGDSTDNSGLEVEQSSRQYHAFSNLRPGSVLL